MELLYGILPFFGYETILTPLFVHVCVRKTITLIINVFLVGLSQFRGLFWFCFVLVGNHSVRMTKNAIFVESRSSPPR